MVIHNQIIGEIIQILKTKHYYLSLNNKHLMA
jgi:translation initiation factor IF-1